MKGVGPFLEVGECVTGLHSVFFNRNPRPTNCYFHFSLHIVIHWFWASFSVNYMDISWLCQANLLEIILIIILVINCLLLGYISKPSEVLKFPFFYIHITRRN